MYSPAHALHVAIPMLFWAAYFTLAGRAWQKRKAAFAEWNSVSSSAEAALEAGTRLPDELQRRLAVTVAGKWIPGSTTEPLLIKLITAFAQSTNLADRVISAETAIEIVRRVPAAANPLWEQALMALAVSCTQSGSLLKLGALAKEAARRAEKPYRRSDPSRWWVKDAEVPPDFQLPLADALPKLLDALVYDNFGDSTQMFPRKAADYAVRRLLTPTGSQPIPHLAPRTLLKMHRMLSLFAAYPGKYDRSCSGECIVTIMNALAYAGAHSAIAPINQIIGAGEFYEDAPTILKAALSARTRLLAAEANAKRFGLLVRPAEQPSNELLRPTVATSDGDAETLVRPAELGVEGNDLAPSEQTRQ